MKPATKRATDVLVSCDGTVWTFEPLSDLAGEWIEEHVAAEGWQWLGNRLVVDHRFARDLVQGMAEAGLAVRR